MEQFYHLLLLQLIYLLLLCGHDKRNQGTSSQEVPLHPHLSKTYTLSVKKSCLIASINSEASFDSLCAQECSEPRKLFADLIILNFVVTPFISPMLQPRILHFMHLVGSNLHFKWRSIWSKNRGV